jgi:DNA-binding transcriptional ArsR family regulator
MRLDLDLPHERRRPRDLEMPEVPVVDGIAEVPPPPPPDALALRMERNEELSNVNPFPKIPSPAHQRTRRPMEIADRKRVERRPRRDCDPRNDVGIGVHLRPQEIKALSEVGRFRVVAVRDLAETVYGKDRSALERDLRYLEEKGIVSLRSVNARRDGSWREPERIQVVTLMRPGKKIVRQVGSLRQDQQLYAGLVKPREVEHDTQIYRAYLKEMERVESLGGSNPRVILDFEIKHNVQRALYAQRKADPERDLDEIKQQVANEFNLPYVDNQIQIPDARIEYDLDQGSRVGSSDIEVVTGAYRPGHLRSKAQAGFRLYAASRDRARLGRDIEGEHHMLREILDL